ncbi:MAG: DUF4339 domain-containing protein [Deltaproteobacteria bacterium]|nr:DUF4339 domain-containing protein [Deltaproteobacteria bacterium]
MKFSCDQCGASFMISDDKLGERGVKVRCKRCGESIIVRPANADDDADSGLSPDLELAGAVSEEEPTVAVAAKANLDIDAETHVGPARDGFKLSKSESEDGFVSLESDRIQQQTAPRADAGDGFDEATRGGAFEPAQLDRLAADKDELDGLGDENALKMPDAGLALGAELSAELGELETSAEEKDEVFTDSLENSSLGDEDASALDASLEATQEPSVDDVPPPPGDFAAATLEGGSADLGDQLTVPMPAAMAGDDDPLSLPHDDAPFGDDLGNDDLASDEGMTASGFDSAYGDEQPPAPEALAARNADEDMLDDQIAGAFSDMFNDPDSLPEPDTDSILGGDLANAADGALSTPEPGAGFPETAGSFGLDDLRDDLDASLEGGESPFPEEEFVDPLLVASGGGTQPSALTVDDEEDDDDDNEEEEEEVEWFVAIEDEEVGPLTIEEVEAEVGKGRLLRDSLVWKTGMEDWIPADEVIEVSSFFDTAAPGKYSSMLDGAPIEDDAPPPPTGADPFDNLPELDGQVDPAWQPHGLTEVYQAANLAEAAQANVKSPYAEPESLAPADDDDAGWSPGAASALSALVEDEMGRLNEGPSMGSGMLPDDDEVGLGSNALDDLPGQSASSSALGATLADLEASSASPTAPGHSLPQMPAVQVAPADNMASPPNTMSAPSLPPSYPHNGGGRSPVIYVGGGLAAFMMLGVFAFGALFFLKSTSDGSSKATKDAELIAAAQAKQNEEGKIALAALNAKKTAAKTEAEKPTTAEVKATDAAAEANAAEAKAAKAKAAEAKAAEAKAAEAKADEKSATSEKKKAKRSKLASAKRKSSKSSRKTKPKKNTRSNRESRPAPKPKFSQTRRPKKKRSGDCDPVLDFDCEEKKSSGPKKKTKLAKSDILGALKKKLRKIKACGKKHGVTGKIKVRWKISRSGATRGVKVVTAKYDGSQVGGCLVRVVKKIRFPAYSGQEMKPITFPFKL